ncbi:C-C motif chemokine 8-like [Microtus pennsylvanicus]|uniref:C-C motif chemokine 8-like n=1 Tax=Microtus pennsylvanicus TaxID=10058 RepID=UPI003F6A6328
MKIPAVLLGLLLIAVTVSPGELAETDEVPPPVSCCFILIQRKIPLRMLQSYQNTSAQCPLAAVIFKTKRGKEICADSRQKWVNDYMKFLDQTSPNLQA